MGGWSTAISRVQPGEIRIRGYDLIDLIGRRSFGDVVFLLLSGDLPAGAEGRMVEACLVAASEHSVVAPSVAAARYAASAGVPLQAAVAAGTISLGDRTIPTPGREGCWRSPATSGSGAGGAGWPRRSRGSPSRSSIGDSG
jgi:citrate synthase